MGVLVWRSITVILGILSIFFEQTGGAEIFKGTENANPNLQKHIQFKCMDACDKRGDIFECETQIRGFCLDKYYLLCMRNARGLCMWQAIQADCAPASSQMNQMLCNELKIQNEKFRRFPRSNVFDMKKMRGENHNRRMARQGRMETDEGMFGPRSFILSDRSTAIWPTSAPTFGHGPKSRRESPSSESRNDQSYPYTMNSKVYNGQEDRLGPAVSTSGNAHAYAVDGNQIAESHYGSPAMVSTYPTTQSVTTPSYGNYRPVYSSYGQGYGHNFISGYGHGYPQSYGQTYGQGYRQPYRQTYTPTVAPTTRPYAIPAFNQALNGYLSSQNPGPGLGHTQSSPFSNIFHSVGLEDPFLMLQQLPEVALTHTSATAGFNPISKPRPTSPPNIASEASAFSSAAADYPSNIYGSWLFPAMFPGNVRGLPTVWSFAN